jgi:putative ATPase
VYTNASFLGTAEIKKELTAARERKAAGGRTILFVDEIHRLNRLQQDVFIADTEDQTITLIGATTQNPFFCLNPALISRSLVCEFKPLAADELIALMQRALADQRGMAAYQAEVTREALDALARIANGDARKALNSLEIAILTTPMSADGVTHVSAEEALASAQARPVFYDRDADYHYDVASALIKSIRGSDPDAAVYWLAVMLSGGEDPRFIARRLVIAASEDIGNADPFALSLAVSCYQATEFIGMPEVRINLGQVVTYLAMAPKSNAAYAAIDGALDDVKTHGSQDVPAHLKDAHYKAAGSIGRGVGYKYPHDFPGAWVAQNYMTDTKRFYEPGDRGREKQFKEKLDAMRKEKGL